MRLNAFKQMVLCRTMLRSADQIAILRPQTCQTIPMDRMTLSEELAAVMERTESVVQKQLLREDVARVEKLEALAGTCPSYEEFEHQGLFFGWTQGDFRTAELHDTLKPLLKSLHAATQAPSAEAHDAVRSHWITFNQERSKRLVGCL